jgi:hypothetical protein
MRLRSDAGRQSSIQKKYRDERAMKSIVAGAVVAVLIAVLGAVVLSMVGMSTADVYSTPNVRL